MKNPITVVAAVMLLLVVASCTSQRDKDIRAIAGLEKQLEKEGARPDPAELKKLLDMYIGFVDANPADTLAQDYLYKAINLSIGVNNGARAMQLIDRTLNDFRQSKYLPETVFMKAYVYENLLGNLGQAATVYNDFIVKYPQHDLADDAAAALKYLGKSPEELVKEFEAMNSRAGEQAGN